MNSKSRKPPHNLDGFIPTQSSRRHVGFNSNVPNTNNGSIRQPRFQPKPLLNQSRGELSDFTDQTTATAQLGNMGRPEYKGQSAFASSEDTEKRIKKPWLPRKIRWGRLFKRTVSILAIFILLFGVWTGWKFIHDSSKLFTAGGGLFGFFDNTKLKGEDRGRVNLLLTGVSTDDPGHPGANLTDSIMIISLDTKNNKAILLSIPRDLWVNIPGYGYGKINVANSYGNASNFNGSGYPAGGNGLLEKVIYNYFQININYYAQINYTAFRDAVNAVGGITVNIQSPDPRGLYDPNIAKVDGGPLKLNNGVQVLNGQTALNLARARGELYYSSYGFPGGDFDRTTHQRQMLAALEQKITSTSVLANPIKLGALFDALGNNIRTDFKTTEVRRAYSLGKKLQSSNIQSLSLNSVNGTNLLANYTSPDGQAALIPVAGIYNYGQIQLTIQKILSSGTGTAH